MPGMYNISIVNAMRRNSAVSVAARSRGSARSKRKSERSDH
jgi:hypothetical protein